MRCTPERRPPSGVGLELDLGITPHHGVGLCAHAAAWKKLQTQHLHFVADDRGRVRIVALRDLERFAAETYTIRPGAARSASQRRTKRYSIIGRIVEGREGTTGPRCEIHAASVAPMAWRRTRELSRFWPLPGGSRALFLLPPAGTERLERMLDR